MSGKQQDKYSKSRFQECSTEQLKDLLEAELMSDESDVEFIKTITELLNEKTGTKHTQDIDAAWKEFKENHAVSRPLYPEIDTPPSASKSTRGRHRGVKAVKAAAAAAILCLLTLTASAFGYNLWAAIARWTDETFRLIGGTEDEDLSVRETSYAPELEELHAALVEHGVTEDVLPIWLPEGYEQDGFYCYESSNGEIIFDVILEKEGEERPIDLYYIVRTDSTYVQYQKNGGDPELYEIGGVSHYIMSNMGEYFAAWTNGRVECSISGFTSREELIRMINSIYEE